MSVCVSVRVCMYVCGDRSEGREQENGDKEEAGRREERWMAASSQCRRQEDSLTWKCQRHQRSHKDLIVPLSAQQQATTCTL